MKKLFTICLLLILLVGKSNAQTQFPFYGFELSNYEVGDTLEYYWNYYGGPPGWSQTYTSISIYHVINKEILSADSIRYTLEDSYIENAQHSGYESYKNSIQKIITNDTIYNNDNNLLDQFLPSLDTSSDNYLQFDTIVGLKTLIANINSVKFEHGEYTGVQNYVAIQNLGIEFIQKQWIGSPPFFTDSLMYAHLSHYGVYGSYHNLYDNINEAASSTPCISIRYDNGSSFLIISDNQNIPLPLLNVYDLLGRGIKSQPVNIGSNLIDMQALPKGMYLYKVESGKNILGQGKLMNM